MLIHRWYRMLQPSAWLSWDTKSAQISQQGFVFQKSILATDEVDFILVSLFGCCLNSATSVPAFTQVLACEYNFAAVWKMPNTGQTSGCDAFGEIRSGLR